MAATREGVDPSGARWSSPEATAPSAAGVTVAAMNDRSHSETYPRSPVPSDRRLWPGELPFTAFGQFGEGRLDARVIDQQVFWVSRAGHAELIERMSDEYVANVISFLTPFREHWFVGIKRCAHIQALGDLYLFGDPGGDALAVALGGPTWDDLTAEIWLESTPLMRALRRRVHGAGGSFGEGTSG